VGEMGFHEFCYCFTYAFPRIIILFILGHPLCSKIIKLIICVEKMLSVAEEFLIKMINLSFAI
jgi:hypothetical protein